MSARGFVKQFSTAFGLRSKGVGGGVAYDYDDVIIAPSFTPLARDYAEIFNCSQPSSIPILELDQGDDECWSSNLDYGNVFGDGHIEWTQVFSLTDGARKTDDSLSHSEGSDHSIDFEDSHNQYLIGSKHNVFCDKITQDEKGCEAIGETKNMAESLSINVTDEVVTLKSAEVNTSAVAVKDLKRLSDEALIRNHSGSISSGGLSRYETDEYIEIDVISGTEFGLYMPISSGMSIDAKSFISEERAFEVICPSDFVLDFGSPNATFKEQSSLRSNAGEVPFDVSTSSSREVVKMASLDKPFIKESAPHTQDQGGACAVPEILMENLNTCSSTNKAGEKAEEGSYNSLEDVKFQEVNSLRLPLVNNHQINASVVISQESSESAPQAHSQRDIDKLNAVSEADILLKITVSRNAFDDCNHRDNLQNKVLDELTSIDFPGDATVINLESQSSKTISPSAIPCNLGNVGPVLKNSTMLQSGGFANRTDTSAIDDHLLSSSDDEIDKNSEAGIYVSDVKRAIREAQVWIKIAKESTGVKGFMNPFVTKSFGQVKIVKEVHDSKVKESPKFFELGQTTIANDCKMSAARKEHIDPWSTSSEIKTTPTNNDGDEIPIEGTVYCESDKQHEKADVVVHISSEEKIELASAIQYVTPWFSISEEKLNMYDTKESFKPVTEKRDATVLDPHDQLFDSEEFLGYASAEENLVSSDTNDEIIGKNSNLLAQYQISEMEDTIMQNLAASEVISIREDVSAACFSNLNEGPAVKESCEIKSLPLQNSMTHETKVAPDEMTVVGKTDEKEGKQLQNTATHNIASEAVTEIFSKKSENDSVSMEMDTHVIVDVPMLISVVPEETDDTSEDSMPPCLNCVDEYPRVEDNDEVEAGKNMVIPKANNISMNDNDLCLSYDLSNVEMMVDADTTREPTMTLLNREFRMGVSEDQTPCILEYIELEIEELESPPTVEFTSIDNYAHPHYGGSEVEPIRGDTVSGKSLARTKENSRSTSRIHYYEKQERDRACFSDLDSGMQASEVLHAVVIKEAEIIEKSHETKNVESFINYQPSADAAAKEDAFSLDPEHDTHEVEAGINLCIPLSDIITNDKTIEFEQEGDKWISESVEGVNFCNPLTNILMNDKTAEFESQGDNMYSEPVDSALEPGKQFCESLPDTIESKSTCDFEKQGGNFVQPLERHGRKKWEIPKESFELPELKVAIFEIQCTAEKDTFEVKSQVDKHERMKWEIPMETYEFPVLGDDDILEERDEIEGQDMEQGAKSAEKPERKKWKIQKEAHEAPNLCGEAVGQTSGQDRFIFITASEDEMMMNLNLHNNLMLSEDTSQHYVFHNEIYANEKLIVPAKRVSSGFCVDDSEEYLTKKHLQEINILYEEERENQLYEASDQLEAKVGEGESDTQGECAKVCEDVNVKDEIKRTLGMLWKRIYKSKHDEDFETTESGAQEEVFGRVVDKDLNLNGPVELVENPKKQNNIAFLNFCGQSSRSNNNTEEASYLKQFEVNGSKSSSREEFISTTWVTEEVQRNTSLASDSCELQEDGINSWDDKTCKQNYNNNASDSAFDSEDTQQSKLLVREGQAPKTKTFPSNVNECGWTDNRIMSRLEDLPSDYALVNDVENAQKLKLLLRDNGSKEGEIIEITSMGKELQEIDGENYLEKEVGELLADRISDRSSTNSEKQDMTSGREESVAALDSRIADGMQLHEPKLIDKKESGPDKSSWKGLEEKESMDKCTKQDKASGINVLPKERADIRKRAGEINMSQLTVKEKLNDDEPSKVEERAKEGLHKQVIPNQEVLQNIIRAKEMERIAVERAIRDVHERAFAEVRERAVMERAKAEARQKSAVSNQEKHEKALLQTKLGTEENSLESKGKAEFESAAVERATAEARQRALEKALSQKDQTSQSSRSGLASPSNYQCGSTSEDRLSDGNSCESALRFKATYERHQQIAERAAKAIDEKNTRDLLVQREQAERNRLAEVLDAEVKRWENGKTSNVRALLSTLQYVLGPDSGWKPIHLTDIVTPEALKKAYRKATLFLHPDKLQQRGATIKQKYICEKVFDLLKEAWKRVDGDER